MGCFLRGFLFGIILFVITVIYIHYHNSNRQLRRPNKSKATDETCIWLNSLVSRILTHLRTEKFNNYVTDIAAQKNVGLNILSIGDDPLISASCIDSKDEPTVNLELRWDNGPSLDVDLCRKADGSSPVQISFDLTKLELTMQTCKNFSNGISLRFFDDIALDFNATILLFGKIELCPMGNPITKMLFNTILRECLLSTNIDL